MNVSTKDIERIVREVLAELNAAPAPTDVAPSAPVPQPAQNNGDLVVKSHLVTMRDLVEGRGAIRRLVVASNAIVTPAVRDELRRRNVALVHAAVTEKPNNTMPRLVLVAARTRHDAAALVRGLTQAGINVEQNTSDCLIAATDQLAGELVKSNTLGLLWTRHTALGLCLANRHPGVRAVLASDAAGTAAAIAAVGANLLVLDPKACTAFQQKKIVGEFCRGGIRQCPESLRKRLDAKKNTEPASEPPRGLATIHKCESAT